MSSDAVMRRVARLVDDHGPAAVLRAAASVVDDAAWAHGLGAGEIAQMNKAIQHLSAAATCLDIAYFARKDSQQR